MLGGGVQPFLTTMISGSLRFARIGATGSIVARVATIRLAIDRDDAVAMIRATTAHVLISSSCSATLPALPAAAFVAPMIFSKYPTVSPLKASIPPIADPVAPRAWPHARNVTSIVQMAAIVVRRFTVMCTVSGSASIENLTAILMRVASTPRRHQQAALPCAAPSTSRCGRTSAAGVRGGGWGRHRGATTIDQVSALQITTARVHIDVVNIIPAMGPRRAPTVWTAVSRLWRAAVRPTLALMAAGAGPQAAAGAATNLLQLVGVRNVKLLSAPYGTARDLLRVVLVRRRAVVRLPPRLVTSGGRSSFLRGLILCCPKPSAPANQKRWCRSSFVTHAARTALRHVALSSNASLLFLAALTRSRVTGLSKVRGGASASLMSVGVALVSSARGTSVDTL